MAKFLKNVIAGKEQLHIFVNEEFDEFLKRRQEFGDVQADWPMLERWQFDQSDDVLRSEFPGRRIPAEAKEAMAKGYAYYKKCAVEKRHKAWDKLIDYINSVGYLDITPKEAVWFHDCRFAKLSVIVATNTKSQHTTEQDIYYLIEDRLKGWNIRPEVQEQLKMLIPFGLKCNPDAIKLSFDFTDYEQTYDKLNADFTKASWTTDIYEIAHYRQSKNLDISDAIKMLKETNSTEAKEYLVCLGEIGQWTREVFDNGLNFEMCEINPEHIRRTKLRPIKINDSQILVSGLAVFNGTEDEVAIIPSNYTEYGYCHKKGAKLVKLTSDYTVLISNDLYNTFKTNSKELTKWWTESLHWANVSLKSKPSKDLLQSVLNFYQKDKIEQLTKEVCNV